MKLITLVRHLAAIGVVLALSAPYVQSAEVDWGTESYSLYADQDLLQDVIGAMATDLGISVILGEELNESVSARFENTSPREIFTKLAWVYDLDWYYDGNFLYVDYKKNSVTSTIKLNLISTTAFKRHLYSLGVIDKSNDYDWRSIENRGLIYLTGPKAFVEKVEALSKKLDESYLNIDIIYKWVDAHGTTHYGNIEGDAPDSAQIIEMQATGRGSSSLSDLATRQQ